MGDSAEDSARDDLQFKLHMATTGHRWNEVNDLIAAHVTPLPDTLDYVARRGLAHQTLLFINAGAAPTPEMLHAAVTENKARVVKILLGAEVTPLQETFNYAALTGNADWVRLMADNGAVMTPEILDTAVRRQTHMVANVLMDKGVVPQRETCDYAQDKGWETLAKKLEAARATAPDSAAVAAAKAQIKRYKI